MITPLPAANPSANGQPPFAPDRLVATASLGPTQASPALPFTPPATYGVYAVRDNQLIELEQVQTAPVDPRIIHQVYPKAGEKNPRVRVGVVKVGDPSTRWIDINGKPYEWILRVKWLPDSAR